jgi:hypothetical protein
VAKRNAPKLPKSLKVERARPRDVLRELAGRREGRRAERARRAFRRAALVDALYAAAPSARVIALDETITQQGKH